MNSMYRFGIWLLALAFVFNGAAVTTWNGPATAAVAIAQGHFADTDSADCGGHAKDTAAVVTYSDQTHDRPHHLRCCGTCMVASLVPDVAVVAVVFNVGSTAFWTAQNHLDGHLVFLDPDIPKSIV